MNKIVFDNNLIQVMSLFTKITKVPLKDCFGDEKKTTFVIFPGSIKKALGNNNLNVRKVEEALGKKIRIVEYSEDITKFIKNMILPFKANEIVYEENIVIIKSDDEKTKGLIIGKKAHNLRTLEENVKRYFTELKEIKVE